MRMKKERMKKSAHQAVKSIMVFLTLNDSPIFRCNFHTKAVSPHTQSEQVHGCCTSTTRDDDSSNDDDGCGKKMRNLKDEKSLQASFKGKRKKKVFLSKINGNLST
jgi:hypothetical protein